MKWHYRKAPVNVRADWTVYEGPVELVSDIHGTEDRARIIAAAPDLLAALQRIVDRATRPVPDSTGQSMVSIRSALLNEARAAIARATGKE